METMTTLQRLENIEMGFEVSKILAQVGYRMDKPAFILTWGQIAAVIAHTLVDYGLPTDRVGRGRTDDDFILDLAKRAGQELADEDRFAWQEVIRQSIASSVSMMALFERQDVEDDEGPLTEQYENATRLGDEESYWVDGGESADFFEDF